jgi:hypothetical protein
LIDFYETWKIDGCHFKSTALSNLKNQSNNHPNNLSYLQKIQSY